MNYQKLDAPLAIALNDVQDDRENSLEPSLVVFIHTTTPPDSTAIDFLERLGISNVTSERNVFTATLSPNAISQLSEQPWVQYLKLSQKLRLVNQR
jgi:hypothetical protein